MKLIQYLMRGWPRGDDWTCKGFAALRYLNAYAAFMSIGSVALSRCISVCFPLYSKAVFDKKKNWFMVVSIWIYASILVLPTIFEWYGKFGYDKIRGKCDYLEEKELIIDAKMCFLGISFLFPMILITVSYSILWKTTRSNSLYLRVNS